MPLKGRWILYVAQTGSTALLRAFIVVLPFSSSRHPARLVQFNRVGVLEVAIGDEGGTEPVSVSLAALRVHPGRAHF
jgi:hypothetical protein